MTSNKEIEDYLRGKLDELGICVFSVFSTNVYGGSLVATTLYSSLDLDELLDKLDYQYRSDKSGFLVLRDTCTVIFTKGALVTLLDKL